MTNLEIKHSPGKTDDRRIVSSLVLLSLALITAVIVFVVQYSVINGMRKVDRQHPSWFNLDEAFALGFAELAGEMIFFFGVGSILVSFILASIGACRKGSLRATNVLVAILITGIETFLLWEFMSLPEK